MQMEKLSLSQLNRTDVESFKNQAKTPVIVVLDSVRSMHNVGSIFRTSDAFAIEAIYLCGITGQPPHREIEKTALGATESVAWLYFEDITEAISYLKTNAYEVYAIEQTTDTIALQDFSPLKEKKYALILGNEVNGVTDTALTMVDGCIEIPQFGTKHSFNVAVTAGIVLWDISTKLSK